MKHNLQRASSAALRLRLIKSFLIIAVVWLGVFLGFRVISNGPTEDGKPALLQKSFHINELVAQKGIGINTESVTLPEPAAGTEPRVNGDIGLEDDADSAHYQIQVQNGAQSTTVDLGQIRQAPETQVSTLFKCVEGWSQTVQYGGLRFSDFMAAFKLGQKPDGDYYKYVGLQTPDGKYYVSLDMKSMRHPQTILAYEMNRHPLGDDNGAPLRLLIPIKYGIKSLKRVGSIVFTDEKPKDYWAERGYDWYSGL